MLVTLDPSLDENEGKGSVVEATRPTHVTNKKSFNAPAANVGVERRGTEKGLAKCGNARHLPGGERGRVRASETPVLHVALCCEAVLCSLTHQPPMLPLKDAAW